MVWRAIEALDVGAQYELLRELATQFAAGGSIVQTTGANPSAATAALRTAEILDHSPSITEYRRQRLQLPDIELGDALITGAEVLSPQAGYVLASCRAHLLEGGGDHERAAEAYLEAASGWEHHGNVPEQTYALLGQGRCLVALADPAAHEPLRRAAELFSSMGYRPALAETEALIAQATAPTS